MPAPELIHVATMTANMGEQFVVPNGPQGTRVIAEVESFTIVGERLNAQMVGTSAADWLTVGPDRSYGTLDVRLTMKTDDDVIIYCEYKGRINLATGRIVSAPLFQCGDEKYNWINASQFIGDGTNDNDTNVLTYELYEVQLT